jgi:hypothetical protein
VFPDLSQPNVNLPTVSLVLDGENAFLLLQFMRYLIIIKKMFKPYTFFFLLKFRTMYFFEQTPVRKVLGVVWGSRPSRMLSNHKITIVCATAIEPSSTMEIALTLQCEIIDVCHVPNAKVIIA